MRSPCKRAARTAIQTAVRTPASANGSRTTHSRSEPKSPIDRAISQSASGGLSQQGSPPIRGVSQFPPRRNSRAGWANIVSWYVKAHPGPKFVRSSVAPYSTIHPTDRRDNRPSPTIAAFCSSMMAPSLGLLGIG